MYFSKKQQGKARRQQSNKFFNVNVRQICSLSYTEKKCINSEERIEILNVAGEEERTLKRTNNLLLPLVLFLPLSFSSASLPTNRCRISE